LHAATTAQQRYQFKSLYGRVGLGVHEAVVLANRRLLNLSVAYVVACLDDDPSVKPRLDATLLVSNGNFQEMSRKGKKPRENTASARRDIRSSKNDVHCAIFQVLVE